MKITKNKLKQLIKEELTYLIQERDYERVGPIGKRLMNIEHILNRAERATPVACPTGEDPAAEDEYNRAEQLTASLYAAAGEKTRELIEWVKENSPGV